VNEIKVLAEKTFFFLNHFFSFPSLKYFPQLRRQGKGRKDGLKAIGGGWDIVVEGETGSALMMEAFNFCSGF
jgi:hypothetical protein